MFDWPLDFGMETPTSSVPGPYPGPAYSPFALGAGGYWRKTVDGPVWVPGTPPAAVIAAAVDSPWVVNPFSLPGNITDPGNELSLFGSWKGVLWSAVWYGAGFITGRALTGLIVGAPTPVSGAAVLSPIATAGAYTRWAIAATMSAGFQVASVTVPIVAWLSEEDPSSAWTWFLGGASAGAYSLARAHYDVLPDIRVPTGPEVGIEVLGPEGQRQADAIARNMWGPESFLGRSERWLKNQFTNDYLWEPIFPVGAP